MKRIAYQYRNFKQRGQLPAIWEDIWYNQLTQERIRRWIERIIRHIQKVIELKGGHGYREGAFNE